MVSMSQIFSRLYGEKHLGNVSVRGIDFGGMTAMEQRAECANIRAAAERVLSGPELDVVLSKFSRDHNHLAAIVRLREYIMPMMGGLKARGISGSILVWIYNDRRHRPSLRAIARHYGISDGTVRNALERVGDITEALEEKAMKRLTEVFVMDGIAKE
jgi:hypothetical protein